MAVDAVFPLGDVAPITATLAATTSSAELSLGAGSLNAFVASTDMHIRVGDTGMAASSASFFRIPANTIFILEMQRNHSFIRIFNPTAGNGVYHIVQLSRS